jgi:hypothetical protein
MEIYEELARAEAISQRMRTNLCLTVLDALKAVQNIRENLAAGKVIPVVFTSRR